MSLMGALHVGNSGLQTSSNALNTTGHNLSNVGTIGYTRQQVLQGNRRYNKIGESYISMQQVGLGVDYTKVRQVRDVFLDTSYRKEAGRAGFYTTSYEASQEVFVFLGEMEEVQFQDSLQKMQDVAQELKNAPADATNQGLFVSKAASFLERAEAVYNGLCSYQDNLNGQIKDMVDKINKYGDQIYELNQKIVAIEAGGIESANDYRDVRNQLLDELGTMASISFEENIYGAVLVQVEGRDFVKQSYVNHMGTTQDSQTGFYNVVWPRDENNAVFNLQQKVSMEHGTDIGSLKALLLARGDRRGTYADLPVRPVREDYADDTEYSKALYEYNEAKDIYNRDVAPSLMVNTMAEFDRLIHDIVTSINEVLNPRTVTNEVKLDDNGNPVLDKDGNPVMVTKVSGFDLFLRKGVDDVTTEEDPDNPPTLYTVSNLKINPLLLQQYTYLGATKCEDGSYTTGFRKPDGSENQEMADALVALFGKEFAPLNPNNETKYTYMEYYNNFVGSLGTLGSVYEGMASNEMQAAESIDASRQQLVGVSDSEELTNMIKFQNAYNASSRYFNVINEMLAHVIERLG